MRAAALAAAVLALGAVGCATPLHKAIERNDIASTSALLKQGTPVRQPGGTAPYVHFACQMADLPVLKALVEAGADVNDSQGMFHSPLYECLDRKKVEMARYLIAHGARLTSHDQEMVARFPDLLQTPRPAPRAEVAARGPVPAASSSDVDAAPPPRAERPDDFALVIGIEEYQSLPKADYGVRDAEAARRHLAALGVPERNIVSLTGPAATVGKLKSYLQEWLPRNVKPASTVFVYYSGHGAPDPASGDAYLVPWDGDPMFLSSTALPLKQVYGDLAKLKAKRVVVALDACFSGAGGRSVLAKGARPLVVKVDEAVPASDKLTVFAAASGSEITGSLDEQGHGIFTYYFLKGLSGAARSASGAVTPKSLYDYLKPRVEDEARRQNREQTPTLAGRDDVSL